MFQFVYVYVLFCIGCIVMYAVIIRCLYNTVGVQWSFAIKMI